MDPIRYGPDKTGYELPEDVYGKMIVSKIKEHFKRGGKEERKRISKTIEKAVEEIGHDGGDVVSLTDPGSRFMRSKNGRLELSYNAQVTVDAAHGVIIANDVVQDAGDSGHLIPQIEQAMENLGEDFAGVEVSADNGYYSIDNLLYLEDGGMDGYIPDDDLATEDEGEDQEDGCLSKAHVPL